ncbi:MAG: hypothetical protein Unbinned4162contig1001_22 [Prokaryotic dsDNA virus sp.]|nr:MAG: hypothetical protein Unbinned4162contig1001_22 [Prokaryotic dsDNA virus sp.]|tara:strand:- start:11819 stop:12319 length:501 start_codon:yes stop_codon:yes gene_type:complete
MKSTILTFSFENTNQPRVVVDCVDTDNGVYDGGPTQLAKATRQTLRCKDFEWNFANPHEADIVHNVLPNSDMMHFRTVQDIFYKVTWSVHLSHSDYIVFDRLVQAECHNVVTACKNEVRRASRRMTDEQEYREVAERLAHSYSKRIEQFQSQPWWKRAYLALFNKL